MSCIILQKKWSVIGKLFPLNFIFYYNSNWSKVLEFYLTSFFNIKSWGVKFRNLLGDFPVHYAALFINRTINNNFMTLLMALHHSNNRFWYLFRCYKSNTSTLSWHAANIESIKSHTSSVSCLFPDVILVWNYHSYKEKAIKLLPYHSFYGGDIPSPPQKKYLKFFFWQSASKKNTKPPEFPFSSILLKNFKFYPSWKLQHSTLMWLLLLLCRIKIGYQLVKRCELSI